MSLQITSIQKNERDHNGFRLGLYIVYFVYVWTIFLFFVVILYSFFFFFYIHIMIICDIIQKCIAESEFEKNNQKIILYFLKYFTQNGF